MKRNHESDVGSNPVGRHGDVSESSSDLQVKRPRNKDEANLGTDDQFWRSNPLLPITGQYNPPTHTNLLGVGTIKCDRHFITELWVQLIIAQVKIQADGRAECYVEWYLPGWLLLQIGRTLWPHVNDRRPDGRLTSVPILNLLRTSPDNGYLVDRRSFYNWIHITCYDGDNPLASYKWLDWNSEINDQKCYQVLTPGQVQPGLTRQPPQRCWVEIPDLNIPIPLFNILDYLEDGE